MVAVMRHFFHEVSQYLVANRQILDAGDHLRFTTTLWSNRDIDKVNRCEASGERALGYVEYPLQALFPSHGFVELFRCFPLCRYAHNVL
jgi:hypothetical protein